jgi:hypothetical protein
MFQSKAIQNLPKIGIFGLKMNRLATVFRSAEKARLFCQSLLPMANFYQLNSIPLDRVH